MKEVIVLDMPRIVVYEDIIDHEYCDSIVKKYTEEGMNPRAGWESYQQSDGQVHEGIEQRNISWNTPEEIKEYLWSKITEATGVPRSHIEAGDIYRYDEGQFFALHHDYPYNPTRINYYANGGDRKHTAIFYLNDGYEGGILDFPKLGVHVVPKKGSMCFLEYDYADEAINESTIHESTPITKGTKWICATFIANGPRVE
jgi:prolyl 4-hydroxylase